MSESEKNPTPANPSQIIAPEAATVVSSVGIPTVWLSYSFAAEWFNDALTEARAGKDHHARRREILFAVCCAESYLVEWIRDQVRPSKGSGQPYSTVYSTSVLQPTGEG
jgi:hypothetical protein